MEKDAEETVEVLSEERACGQAAALLGLGAALLMRHCRDFIRIQELERSNEKLAQSDAWVASRCLRSWERLGAFLTFKTCSDQSTRDCPAVCSLVK